MILENVKVILLDIEGTTTPIDFVHQTLFPFARARMFDFVKTHFNEIRAEVAALETEHAADYAAGKYTKIFDEDSARSVANYAEFLIADDRKSTPLKSLQGLIWREGYESGNLQSQVFEDVPRAFERWTADGKTIAIFSSGSRLAQKYLFAHTDYGDLSRYISAYFDTTTGGKREAPSYRKIAAAESFPPVENFLFISDIAEELDAARHAGMRTLLAVREGNAPAPDDANHQIVRSFDEIE